MSKFKVFTKAKFEYELSRIRRENNLSCWKDVTDEFPDSLEYIYSIPLEIGGLSILIFSSVDVRTDTTRDNGSDAVRVVYRWKTKNGDLYKHISKHTRIDTLFLNLEKSIMNNYDVKSFYLKSIKWSTDCFACSIPL